MTSPYHSSGSEYGAEFDLDVPTAEEDVNLPSWLERNARGGGPYSQTTFARREVLAGRLWHALSATGVWSHIRRLPAAWCASSRLVQPGGETMLAWVLFVHGDGLRRLFKRR
ncbi:hypothetical protein GPALN_010110 [Globodera pallida]|nr:hypothetical protein GPALN_010110 [Globodera pallida]